MNPTNILTRTLACATLAWLLSTNAAAADKLVPIKLPNGIEVSIPADWKILTDGGFKSLAKANLTASDEETGRPATLLHASGHGEVLTVKVTTPPSVRPDEVRTYTDQQCQAFSQAIGENLAPALKRLGLELKRLDTSVLGTFAGRPALTTVFERSTDGGKRTLVQVTDVFTDRQQVTFAVAYPTVHAASVEARMNRIRDTVVIRD